MTDIELFILMVLAFLSTLSLMAIAFILDSINRKIVAEIKRILSAFENSDEPVDRLRASILIGLLSFIDTLEVKEVDLDYIKDELDRAVKIYKPDGNFGWGTLYNIATHFFELGMRVSNKAQKGE